TAEFILNIFHNINRLTGSNFDLGQMGYDSGFNSAWAQIEMYAVSSATQEIVVSPVAASFRRPKDDLILVQIRRMFDPLLLPQQRAFFGFTPIGPYPESQTWFSLLLVRKGP